MNANALLFQLPWAMVVAILKLGNADRRHTITLFNGTKMFYRGGGWYTVYGYHYSGHDVAEIYGVLMEALHDAYLDSPIDMKKWRIYARA